MEGNEEAIASRRGPIKKRYLELKEMKEPIVSHRGKNKDSQLTSRLCDRTQIKPSGNREIIVPQIIFVAIPPS